MLDTFQFFYYLFLISILYYLARKNMKRATYYDGDIVNEMLTSYAGVGGGADSHFAPYYDLVFAEDKELALHILKKESESVNKIERWICFGFVSVQYLKTDQKFALELNLNGNLVIIEVSHDNEVWTSDPNLIKDMRTVLRENMAFAFYISMFSRFIKSNVPIDKVSFMECIQKLEVKGISSECYHIENQIDYGLPHIQVKTTTDLDIIGLPGVITEVDILIGGYHFKVFADYVGEIFYVNESRVSRKKFVKLFKLGVREWALRNKRNREKLHT